MDEANGAIRSGEAMTDKPTGPLDELNRAFTAAYVACPDYVVDDLKRRVDDYVATLLASRQSDRPATDVREIIKNFCGLEGDITDNLRIQTTCGRLIEFAALVQRAAVLPPDGLREALSKLVNECRALLGTCELDIRQAAGNTNVNCWKQRIVEAVDALARATPAERPQDELYDDCVKFVRTQGKCQTQAIQRQFRIGFGRANELVEALERAGVVSDSKHGLPREVRAAGPETPVDAKFRKSVGALLEHLDSVIDELPYGEYKGLGVLRGMMRALRADLRGTPSAHPCPVVGCNRTEKHTHPISGPQQAEAAQAKGEGQT